MFENSISGSLPLELGMLHSLRYLRMQDNRLQGNLTRFRTLGDLRQLVTLDLYNNAMDGEARTRPHTRSTAAHVAAANRPRLSD